jgi:phage tail sheath protein FI
MATQYTYPGVYIEEFAPAAPITGVGTSTAAFIGPAASGVINLPVKLTSLDQFVATFGAEPLDGFYLYYAVRGFFENGGQVCYIVRASNGDYWTAQIHNNVLKNDVPLINVQARMPGTAAINVNVTNTHLISKATVYHVKPKQGYTVTAPRELTLPAAEDAAQFRPGDTVNLGGSNNQVIQRISGAVIRLMDDPNLAVNWKDTIRLADLPVGTTTFRILPSPPLPPGTLVPGTMLTITQSGQSDSQIVDTVQTENLQTNPAMTTYRVTFRRGLKIPIDQSTSASVQSEDFDLSFQLGAAPATVYPNLSIDPVHPRYFLSRVNDDPTGLVTLSMVDPPPPVAPPGNLPGPKVVTVNSGATEDLSSLGVTAYTNALDALRQIDDVNQIAIPDCVTLPQQGDPEAVQQELITHCEQMGDRFAVLDSRPGLELFSGSNPNVEDQRKVLDSTRGYAALYFPWLYVPAIRPGPPILVPPSGHVCGIMARSDTQRGVHKAPANEIVSNALGVERNMSDVDQGQLNIQGINVIRQFQGGRPTLWGARTTATDTNWQYVNVRRLFLFLEESIQEGIRWAVFEPNTTSLWKQLNGSITDFLKRVWRDGALFGVKATDAFYVRIDETLNPDSSRALGRLYIEIGVRPAYPAEFIIVRIGIWQGGSAVDEG